jgi:hypothetical protein
MPILKSACTETSTTPRWSRCTRGNGRLGSKIIDFSEDQSIALPRALYENWWLDKTVSEIARFFELGSFGLFKEAILH